VELFSVVLVMLLAVIASGYVARLSPLPVPLPLLQIAFGVAIATTTNFRTEFDPEIFFLLFLPPLLFLDGWRIPKQGLFKDGATILELAFGLVIFTVIGVGFFIHWLIPSVPLAVAFALAAVVSPTDPIAVSAIAARTPIPKRVMHILEGESLLNDASGLVCLRFAIAAALTGSFSLLDASLTFLQLALGGVAIGAGVTWAITRVKRWLSRTLGEESGSQILISLVIPFAAYLLAEQFHCSGILAAVAAGVTMSYAEISGGAQAETRVSRSAVWDTIQFALNGIIFVLLGEQLPDVVESASETVRSTGHEELWWLAVYAFAITSALGALRFVWVWVSLRMTILRRRRAGETGPPQVLRLVAVISVAGVRGAITLAGALIIPLTLTDGTQFPARDLAILLAASVIISSLVGASVFLPLLLKGLRLPSEEVADAAEAAARDAAAEAAILAIERTQHDLAAGRADPEIYAEAAARMMSLYRVRIEGRSQTGRHRASHRAPCRRPSSLIVCRA
jgi:CPA1 family monovalent cation:H+ antiporter